MCLTDEQEDELLETIAGCIHVDECLKGCRYGKGCYEDEQNSAMGGKPWQECYCGVNSDGSIGKQE